MKKIFFGALLLFAGIIAQAQFMLRPNVPAVGLVHKNQLWNILIINNTNGAQDCTLSFVLKDRITGQDILTGSTALFTVKSGAGQYNFNTLSPVQYNNLSGAGDTKLEGLLPAGAYTGCYSLAYNNGKVNLADECIQFDVEPLSPPMLIFPADSTHGPADQTTFNWMAPTPAGMFENLHYDIVMTEISEGQTAAEAIQSNLPLYTEGNLIANSMSYPAGAPAFEKNKWYAWQIIAKDDKNYAAKSETWVFKTDSLPSELIPAEGYAEVKPYYAGKKVYCSKVIRFSFVNPYEPQQLDFTIREVATKKEVARVPKIAMSKGLNQIAIELKEIRGLRRDREYCIEIHNLGTMNYYLNFIPTE
jgi:hypothetical protein